MLYLHLMWRFLWEVYCIYICVLLHFGAYEIQKSVKLLILVSTTRVKFFPSSLSQDLDLFVILTLAASDAVEYLRQLPFFIPELLLLLTSKFFHQCTKPRTEDILGYSCCLRGIQRQGLLPTGKLTWQDTCNERSATDPEVIHYINLGTISIPLGRKGKGPWIPFKTFTQEDQCGDKSITNCLSMTIYIELGIQVAGLQEEVVASLEKNLICNGYIRW